MTAGDRQLVTLTESMLPAIETLWSESALRDPCSADLLIEKMFADAGVVPQRRIGLFEHDRLLGLAVGAVRSDLGYLKMIAVRPTYRRQGIGTLLTEQIEQTFAAAGVRRLRVAESAPNYLTPGIDAQNQETIEFLEHVGFQRFGEAFNQEVDLTTRDWDSAAAKARLLTQRQIEVVRATLDDRAAIDALLDVEWPTWKEEVHSALANEPSTVHIAKQAGNVIAFAAHDANNKGTGWFGPMGTAPAYAGQGLGRVLLDGCLEDMKRQGHLTATIPWVGPLEFYEKLAGAKLSRTFVRMEKEIEFDKTS